MIPNGNGAGYFLSSDPDAKNSLVLTVSALLAGKTLTVRFQNDNVNCASMAGVISGLYLNR